MADWQIGSSRFYLEARCEESQLVVAVGLLVATGSIIAQQQTQPARQEGQAAAAPAAPANLPRWAYGYAEPGLLRRLRSRPRKMTDR